MLPHSSRQKVVFLGEQSVGKTSIINRFINDQFDESQRVMNVVWKSIVSLIFIIDIIAYIFLLYLAIAKNSIQKIDKYRKMLSYFKLNEVSLCRLEWFDFLKKIFRVFAVLSIVIQIELKSVEVDHETKQTE